MSDATDVRRGAATGWRHARAIVLLPFMNTVLIPAAIVTRWPPLGWQWSAPDVAWRSIGLTLLVAGVAVAAHSIGLFVRFGNGTLAPWDSTSSLVVAGAYRYCRNPMKAGLFAVLAGEALVLRSLPLAAWLAIFAVANAVYIRLSEEPGLRDRFGSSYERYCERVPRWIPRLPTRLRAVQEEYR
jgi:protein-S-isoprenylcysteine O-methyltransferase Ste14